jgi:hypothetical protein
MGFDLRIGFEAGLAEDFDVGFSAGIAIGAGFLAGARDAGFFAGLPAVFFAILRFGIALRFGAARLARFAILGFTDFFDDFLADCLAAFFLAISRSCGERARGPSRA